MAEGLKSLRVLVVDDNEQMRIIIGAVLSAVGVGRLFYAGNGREALETLHREQIDLAFVDYEMPVMNGLDFISRVRASGGEMRFLPIIMLTGHSDMLRLNAARDRGVNEFLAKPVTARNIVLRLNAVIFKARDYVQCDDFFGPDRRRRAAPDYAGPMRRAVDRQDFVEL